MESAKIFLLVFFILLALSAMVVLLYAFTKFTSTSKEVRFETITAKAKVTQKNYTADYMSVEPVHIGFVVLPIRKYHFEEFNVFLDYEGNEFCINDKNLFANVNFGDLVDVKVVKGYNKKNKLMSTKLFIM